MTIWTITLYGLLTGIIGTGLGGVLSIFTRNRGNGFLSAILSYAAGTMLSVVTFGLLPEAFQLASFPFVLIGIGAGILFLTLTEEWTQRQQTSRQKNSEMLRLGITISIGIALHNLPEGLAIGSGMEAAFGLGLSLALTILLHDIPEGLSMAIPLEAGGMSLGKAAFITALSGVPTGLGAFIGAAAGTISPAFLTFCLSFAAGAMLYVTAADIIPQSQTLFPGRVPGMFMILGVITGMIISICI